MGLIEKQLLESGYRMLGDNRKIEKLIIDIIKDKNIRYLKAIPYLIYKHKIDILHIAIKKKENRELFHAILAITAKIFYEFNIRGILPPYYEKNIESKFKIEKKLIKQFQLDYNEFMREFELQKEKKSELMIDKQKIYAERDLQMFLSKLFTNKEKQIIKRLTEEKPISKTDYEYYSRKTKKKINSILGLYDFAKTIYTKTPEYDEDLFFLKKELENFIGKDKISLMEFFLWDQNKIIIKYKKDSRLHNTTISIHQIKDKMILNLIMRYKEHDFT